MYGNHRPAIVTPNQLIVKNKNILLAIITVCAISSQCFGQADFARTTTSTTTAQPLSVDSAATTGGLTQGASDFFSNAKEKKPREAPWWVQRFSLGAGFFLAINNTNIEVSNSQGGRGTDINFENDLGYSGSSPTFLGDFQWRASARSRFDLGVINLDRSTSYTLQKTINFGDQTYDINSAINSSFNTTIYRFSYGYALFSDKNYELGLQLGFHIIKGDVSLAYNGQTISRTASTHFNFTAPLPDLGIWGGYAFGPRWALTGEFGYLALTIDNIYGRILTGELTVNYALFQQLRLQAGYSGFNFKVSTNDNSRSGDLSWGYNGPQFALVFTFGHKGWN